MTTASHGLSIEQQQRALFVADHGRGMGALDVLRGGIEGSRARRPALTWISQNSALPHFRVVAVMLLAAWGDADALRVVQEWAQAPEGTPAVLQSEFQDPFSGCDNAFELLANGVGTWLPGESAAVRADRVAALRALIEASPWHYVGRAMARAVEHLELPWGEIAESVDLASHDALDRLSRQEGDECDLAFQSAVLVGLLAQHNDASGARAAGVLLSFDLPPRAVRELLIALGLACGRDTTELLRELDAAGGPRGAVAREALHAQTHPYRPDPPTTPDAPNQEHR